MRTLATCSSERIQCVKTNVLLQGIESLVRTETLSSSEIQKERWKFTQDSLFVALCNLNHHSHSFSVFPPQPMPWWSLKGAALRPESWSPKLWSCTAQVSSLAGVVTRLKMMSKAGILESDLVRRAFASWLPSHSHLTCQTSAISLLSKFYCFFTLIWFLFLFFWEHRRLDFSILLRRKRSYVCLHKDTNKTCFEMPV